MAPTPRYAVYYYPWTHPGLAHLANAWLGRDVVTGEPVAPPMLPGLGRREIDEMTEGPRHYGIHATLKAPFFLAPGMGRAQLVEALRGFAAGENPFECPPLEISTLGDFAALRPATVCREMNALAAACVHRFDRFRAPRSVAESLKRPELVYSPRQRRNLARYGYPYIGVEYRCHLTLTNPLPAVRLASVTQLLADYFRPELGQPLMVDGISLYWQPDHRTPFRIIDNFHFGGET